MIYKSYLFLFLFFLIQGSNYAQQLKLEGLITDSISIPIEFANVIAKPQSKEVPIAFSITNQKGLYKLLP